ncbi:protein LKAAEAR1 [Protopterus annectens]|uniref:protein LKAAEAR1 n=1 Tax=Protopterus annectens TaxID=7888 RepID=UPI001CFA5FE7|nr:protein LKAAEAR1 [Protopterus annectens]
MAEKHVQDGKEKFVPKNWKVLAPSELRRMAPQQRARYMAYEEPNKVAVDSMQASQKRINETVKASQERQKSMESKTNEEESKQEKLIGQLKAAEARSRVRILRLHFQSMRAQEINQLILSQPTARDAVRLEVLLPPRGQRPSLSDPVDKLERKRIEQILEDDQGLTVNRKP